MKFGSFIFLLLITSHLFSVDPWYQDKKRGWYYFEETKEPQEVKKDLAHEQTVTLENAPQVVEQEKEKTYQLLCFALLRPTEENISRYLYQQRKLINQSAKFSSSWKSSLLSNPSLSFGLPKTDYAQLLEKAQEHSRREGRLDQYKKDHFLLFIFKGEDFFSKEFSSVLANFSSRKQWKVQAVSLDGRGTQEFSEFTFDKGVAEAIDHKITPSIYLVHPEKNYIIPIGSGMIDEESIEKNIDFQMLRLEDPHHAL